MSATPRRSPPPTPLAPRGSRPTAPAPAPAPAPGPTATPTTPARPSSSAVSAGPTTPATPVQSRRGGADAAGSDRIKVFVRARGFQKSEAATEEDLAVRMSGATVEVRDPKRGAFPFTFDDCFWSNELMEDPHKPFASQEDIFDHVGKPLVDNVIAGYHSSIIAYGESSSGKTYSIFGPPQSLGTKREGLIPRVCNALFAHVNNPPIGTCFRVGVSMVEIYLEEAFDLLNSHERLKVRGDSRTGFSLSGLKCVPVTSYTQIMELLKKAEQQKTFGATALNERSSRAHTLFQLELRAMTESGTRTSKVVLADLAGCERVKIAKTDSGVPLEQACNINLSLLSLGTCIEAVISRSRAGQSPATIAEFRNSTLTKLLKESLAGNSRTAMLVTIAPHVKNVPLTLQALRFADRAKQMTTHASVNSALTSTSEDALAVKENILRLFESKKLLLEKECELELQAETLRRKQDELEARNRSLLEERREMRERLEMMTEEQRRAALERERAIAEKLTTLEGEMGTVALQRDELEQRFNAACDAHGEGLRQRERLEQQVQQLTVALEVQSLEQAEELRALQERADDRRVSEIRALRAELSDAAAAALHSAKAEHAAREVKLREYLTSREEELADLWCELAATAAAASRAMAAMTARASAALGIVIHAAFEGSAAAALANETAGVAQHSMTQLAAAGEAQRRDAVRHAEELRARDADIAALHRELEQRVRDAAAADANHAEHVLSLEERLDAAQRDHADEAEALRAELADARQQLLVARKEVLEDREAAHFMAIETQRAVQRYETFLRRTRRDALLPLAASAANTDADHSPTARSCGGGSNHAVKQCAQVDASSSSSSYFVDPTDCLRGDGSDDLNYGDSARPLAVNV